MQTCVQIEGKLFEHWVAQRTSLHVHLSAEINLMLPQNTRIFLYYITEFKVKTPRDGINLVIEKIFLALGRNRQKQSWCQEVVQQQQFWCQVLVLHRRNHGFHYHYHHNSRYHILKLRKYVVAKCYFFAIQFTHTQQTITTPKNNKNEFSYCTRVSQRLTWMKSTDLPIKRKAQAKPKDPKCISAHPLL